MVRHLVAVLLIQALRDGVAGRAHYAFSALRIAGGVLQVAILRAWTWDCAFL
jgi:hypothetical protein